MRKTSSFNAGEKAGTISKYCLKALPRLNISGKSTRDLPQSSSAARRLFELVQIILGEHLVRQIAQLHSRVFQDRFLAFAQRVFDDELGRPRLAEHRLEVFVARGLEQAVGE